MRAGLLLKFDPSDPAVFADPYPEYARLREAGPLARGFAGQWVLSRHADISWALRDRRLTKLLPPTYYESLVGTGESSAFLGRMQELFHDRRVTRTLSRAFNPKLTPSLTRYATAAAERLLAPALDTGRFDAVADVGVPLPVDIVCELFGVPRADREQFRVRIADMVTGYNDAVVSADAGVVAARRTAADAAVRWLREYLRNLLAPRRAAPGEDALSALVAVTEGGGLTDDAVLDSAVMSFYAGFETAAAMLTSGLAVLSQRPDQWSRLRADRWLVRSAVEEFVRFDAPIQIGVRRVLEGLDIDGQAIRPGRLLVLLIGSANHDERVFADPAELDIGRYPNPHLSYGGGGYGCIGAALARLEGAVVLDTMVRMFATLAPAGPAVRRPRFNFRAYSSVPLAVTAS
jgi:cytochrome P450